MPGTVKVNGVEKVGRTVRFDTTIPDGRRFLHVIPDDTLEWRAAEYGIGAADLDTLLEIVLAEPHAGEPAAGHGLHDAPDVATARAALLSRTQAVRVDRGTGQTWEQAKSHFVMHPEALALKREHVRRTRAALAAQAARPVPSEVDRVAALRAALDVTKGGGRHV